MSGIFLQRANVTLQRHCSQVLHAGHRQRDVVQFRNRRRSRTQQRIGVRYHNGVRGTRVDAVEHGFVCCNLFRRENLRVDDVAVRSVGEVNRHIRQSDRCLRSKIICNSSRARTLDRNRHRNAVAVGRSCGSAVILAGGISEAAFPALSAALSVRLPDRRFYAPTLPPVEGALRLAIRTVAPDSVSSSL